MSWLTTITIILAGLYILDRTWKMAAIWHFFHQDPPPDPQKWPSVSLIQPITASPNDLRAVLVTRAQITYPEELEQIIICDAPDLASQAVCNQLKKEFPGWKYRMILLESNNGVAIKTAKMLAGLETAAGEVLCFIDDDILLRRDTIRQFVCHLQQPGIGSVFGLACYTNWRSVWGGLMSSFVNTNALLNYIPLTYLVDPYTITGHIYALKRTVFYSIGGLNGMKERLDDDHELARRVNRAGLHNLQTPVIYNVDNELSGFQAFLAQIKRWFIFPRELMLPGISARLRILTLVTSLPHLLPGLVLLLAPFGGRLAWIASVGCLLVFLIVYFWGERSILKEPAPFWGWPLLMLVALVLPFLIVFMLFSDNTIRWRGKQYRVRRDGSYEIIN